MNSYVNSGQTISVGSFGLAVAKEVHRRLGGVPTGHPMLAIESAQRPDDLPHNIDYLAAVIDLMAIAPLRKGSEKYPGWIADVNAAHWKIDSAAGFSHHPSRSSLAFALMLEDFNEELDLLDSKMRRTSSAPMTAFSTGFPPSIEIILSGAGGTGPGMSIGLLEFLRDRGFRGTIRLFVAEPFNGDPQHDYQERNFLGFLLNVERIRQSYGQDIRVFLFSGHKSETDGVLHSMAETVAAIIQSSSAGTLVREELNPVKQAEARQEPLARWLHRQKSVTIRATMEECATLMAVQVAEKAARKTAFPLSSTVESFPVEPKQIAQGLRARALKDMQETALRTVTESEDPSVVCGRILAEFGERKLGFTQTIVGRLEEIVRQYANGDTERELACRRSLAASCGTIIEALTDDLPPDLSANLAFEFTAPEAVLERLQPRLLRELAPPIAECFRDAVEKTAGGAAALEDGNLVWASAAQRLSRLLPEAMMRYEALCSAESSFTISLGIPESERAFLQMTPEETLERWADGLAQKHRSLPDDHPARRCPEALEEWLLTLGETGARTHLRGIPSIATLIGGSPPMLARWIAPLHQPHVGIDTGRNAADGPVATLYFAICPPDVWTILRRDPALSGFQHLPGDDPHTIVFRRVDYGDNLASLSQRRLEETANGWRVRRHADGAALHLPFPWREPEILDVWKTLTTHIERLSSGAQTLPSLT